MFERLKFWKKTKRPERFTREYRLSGRDSSYHRFVWRVFAHDAFDAAEHLLGDLTEEVLVEVVETRERFNINRKKATDKWQFSEDVKKPERFFHPIYGYR